MQNNNKSTKREKLYKKIIFYTLYNNIGCVKYKTYKF